MGKKLRSLKLADDCLIIFAKEPKWGRVKTRLKTVLSEQQCVNLYKAFLRDTYSLSDSLTPLSKILAYDSLKEEPQYLKKIFRKYYFYKQEGNDLGTRMHNAFLWGKRSGAKRMVIIGSDSPTLPVQYIQQAFKSLTAHDVVLGPSRDGGYYLIGLIRPDVDLFKDVAWSLDQVFKKTVENAQKLKMRVHILKEWHDVDDAESLKYLQKKLSRMNKGRAFWTRKFLNGLKIIK